MGEFVGHLGLFVQIGGFDHQAIGVLADRLQVAGTAGIPYVHQAHPLAQRAEHLLRSDQAAIRQRYALAVHQVAPPGAGRDIERLGQLGQERAARLLLEQVAKTIRPAVVDREGCHRKIIRVENHARLDGDETDLHRRADTAQHHPIQQVTDTLQSRSTAVQLEELDRLPAGEGGEQPGQPQDMVQVAMRNEDAVQPLKANPRLHDLALCAFPTIDQEAVFVVHHQLCGKPTASGRGGSRSTKE